MLVLVPPCGANFSVKEKDEASLFRECGIGAVECLHSPFCRGLKIFVFRPGAGLSITNPLLRLFVRSQLKDQHMLAAAKTAEEQATAIESKRNLLAYLRSGPKHLTIESYLCLARLLTRAGWSFDSARWTRGGHNLSTIEAAILELDRQVASDRDRLLRRTVGAYRPIENLH